MELREWLIILGLALVSLIVIDGARRLQRQRRVPRLDQAEKDLSASQLEDDPDEAAKAAEINWELPNGGARVVKPADYSGLGHKPKLERQEHPGPSRVLSEFRRSASAKAAKRKAAKAESIANSQSIAAEKAERPAVAKANTATTSPSMPTEHERLEPSISMASTSMNSTSKASTLKAAEVPQDREAVSQHEAEPTAAADSAAMANATASNANAEATEPAPQAAIKEDSTTREAAASPDDMSIRASETDTEASVQPDYDAEPVLRAEPEDAVFAKHANDHSPKRRQLRSDTAGEHDELDDDEVDEYRLIDFEGMGRSLKRRLIERRKEKQRKKAEKALRDKELAKQKAERKAEEAEQRREAKEAADAERAREASRYEEPLYEEGYSADFDENADYASDAAYDDRAAEERGGNDSVRIHPTLEKALRHDVSGEHAKETLSSAEEVVVISVLSRDPEGFDGSKLLELMMVCGLRYSREMGIFHRFETESDDSELQFSMVNVVKPGTFPIEEMGEFMTPGITLLMPLPGALDSAAAFEAMVETAMVVVRHMGGELKDENRSVMTAQTIEFARQRVREFERRHRLHRHMQVR